MTNIYFPQSNAISIPGLQRCKYNIEQDFLGSYTWLRLIARRKGSYLVIESCDSVLLPLFWIAILCPGWKGKISWTSWPETYGKLNKEFIWRTGSTEYNSSFPGSVLWNTKHQDDHKQLVCGYQTHVIVGPSIQYYTNQLMCPKPVWLAGSSERHKTC